MSQQGSDNDLKEKSTIQKIDPKEGGSAKAINPFKRSDTINKDVLISLGRRSDSLKKWDNGTETNDFEMN